MTRSNTILAGICLLMLAGPSEAADFRISFDWSGLKLCNSGSPNKVSNPRFRVSRLPAGTKLIKFTLTDLDVPGYQHGGGWVKMSGDGTVPANAFKYKSPCPPSGRHTYEWRAEARSKKGGATLGVAAARRNYPE